MNRTQSLASNNNSSISSNSSHSSRKFTKKDIPAIIDKIFSQYDTDGDKMFSRGEFSKVIKSIMKLVQGDCPNEEDVMDLFNLIDINGDETVSKKEL